MNDELKSPRGNTNIKLRGVEYFLGGHTLLAG